MAGVSEAKRISERLTAGHALDGGTVVDEAAGTISGVVLCGFDSLNGRKYPREVLEANVGKYAGAKVYLNHSRQGRLWHEWVGVVRDPKPGPDGRPRGTLRLFKSEPASAKVFEAARECPDKFGMSHVIVAKTRREGTVDVVESYESVESVDIVTDPATNPGGLLEHREGRTVLTVKALCEALVRHPKVKAADVGALKTLAEMDGMDAAPATMDAPPADDVDPAQGVKDAFAQAVAALAKQALDGDIDSKTFAKQVKKLVDSHADIAGTGSAAEPDADDDPTTPESKRVKPEDVIAECEAAKLDNPPAKLVVRLATIADKDTRAFVIEQAIRAAKTNVAEEVRSTGRDKAERLTEAERKKLAESKTDDGHISVAAIKDSWGK